jgi:hypothetical protein
MKSDAVRKGIDRAPHRSLFKAMGYTDKELRRPLVGIANSANEIIPGHIHLDKLVEAVKAGVYIACGMLAGLAGRAAATPPSPSSSPARRRSDTSGATTVASSNRAPADPSPSPTSRRRIRAFTPSP